MQSAGSGSRSRPAEIDGGREGIFSVKTTQQQGSRDLHIRPTHLRSCQSDSRGLFTLQHRAINSTSELASVDRVFPQEVAPTSKVSAQTGTSAAAPRFTRQREWIHSDTCQLLTYQCESRTIRGTKKPSQRRDNFRQRTSLQWTRVSFPTSRFWMHTRD